jgi:hypothetical protein
MIVEKMIIPITEELRSICKEIVAKNLSIEDWCLIESDDMFQTDFFQGGFDATEGEFTFAYFADNEYWFQLSLDDVDQIANGSEPLIEGVLADK